MFSFSRSLDLVRASWGVLKKDKEIMVFPIISALASIGVAATFIVPVVLYGMNHPAPAGAGGHRSSVQFDNLWYLYSFLFYLCSYFITIFFNVGVMTCAAKRMDGGDPTVADGFAGAFKHIGSIFMWALVSATVGMVLRAISERSGLLGKIVTGVLGMAWSILTYFAVPVMIFEGAGVMDATKRSGELIKKTWGEALVGETGMGLVFGLLALVGFIPMIAAIVLATNGTIGIALAIMIGAGTIAYWIALAVVSAALQGVFHVAVYRYAATGQISDGYSEDLVAGVWRQKESRGMW